VPGFLPDTSCIVAAVCGWHEHHAAAASEIERRLARRERMHLAAPALLESYAVLTRLPPPYRLAPADTLALLDASFLTVGRTIALDAIAYQRLLRRAPADNLGGGRIYDAVIATCAVRAAASALLTFNAPHFLVFAARGLEIVVPSA
jgi:predicted nucleic acid-binding protein